MERAASFPRLLLCIALVLVATIPKTDNSPQLEAARRLRWSDFLYPGGDQDSLFRMPWLSDSSGGDLTASKEQEIVGGILKPAP
ncbi:hypothetical protein PRIC1_001699 [Phytophthora ramorum]|uniref:uncharacterized protein n=1 Tax=Phytophthora ramorum TaxID=164328 RepID=UPI0030A6CA9D|nr:hypothetical protein KRP23_13202 [Phytophthora ramorum]